MFSFNYNKYDFWKIYDCIKQFYPIGIQKDESRLYYSYPGLKDLEQLTIDNRFRKVWNEWHISIAGKIGKEVIGTTYGQAPSFSSYVVLDKLQYDGLLRTKELHFFVSILGPFYTVIGQDHNEIKIGDKTFRSTNYLVTSPENEYADIFQLLCDDIEVRFKDYRFVPFDICKQTIDGLGVKYVSHDLNFIFSAVFNNNSHVDLTGRTLGNNYYKMEDWIKEGYIDDGAYCVAYPPRK